MRPQLITFLLAAVSAPCLFSQTAASQGDKIEAAPLIVTAQFSSSSSADCAGSKGLIVKFRYEGTKPLRGYLVEIAFHNGASGQLVSQQTLQEARDARQPILANGAEWTRIICSVAKSTTEEKLTVVPRVDVLKFDDGSISGPAHLSESHQLIGMIDGMDFSVKTTDLLRYVSPILPYQGPLPLEHIQFQTLGPLRFESGVRREENGQEMLAAEATNVGGAPIRGYVFTESFFDPTAGNHLRSVTTKELETRGNPADYLAPGGTWVAGARKFSRLADGTLANYTITLDLVVFADGTTFGPKHSRESEEVLGMFRGIDAANSSNRGTSKAPQPQ
jgi:hypothetical protein